jgi:hypothetical protein
MRKFTIRLAETAECGEEARCEAVFPDNSTQVLMIGVKCLCFRAKAAHISGHLPVISTCCRIFIKISSQTAECGDKM